MKPMTVAMMLSVGAGLLGGCAPGYYGPPPPGWRGEGWHRHVARCLRHYPRYDPDTDLIERPGGPVPCPL